MSSKKILVVAGADAAARAAYARLLAHHALFFADDALQMMARLADHRDVEVILVDLAASRRHGADVLVRIAANPLAHRLPLIVVGADDALLRLVKATHHGDSTAYLGTPIHAEELARALRRVTEPPLSQRASAG